MCCGWAHSHSHFSLLLLNVQGDLEGWLAKIAEGGIVDLRGKGIDDAGAIAIADSLKNNTTLESSELANLIGD